MMEYSSYMFLGLGVAVSVLGFFLKRMKEEIDVQKAKTAKLEISSARHYETKRNLESLRKTDVAT